MDKILLSILAMAGTAFAALAPAGANSISPEFQDSGDRVAQIQGSWQSTTATQGCRVEMSWKYDYSGKPYLKKVRICA